MLFRVVIVCCMAVCISWNGCKIFVEKNASFFRVFWRWRPYSPLICSPYTSLRGVVTNYTIIQFFQCTEESRTPACLITLANKYLQKPCLESQEGVEEATKKTFVREEKSRENLNFVFVCWCCQQELQVAGTISAAVQHWPQQMQGCNYISGSSYRRQDAAFFVRPRVRDGIRLHPQRFHVEHQARLQRHEYIATRGSRLRLPPPKTNLQNVLYISWYFKEKEACEVAVRNV